MSKWTSYSYINLSARGFDCLSYLACAMISTGYWSVQVRKISGVNIARTYFNIVFVLIPVADIKNGVLIRGDQLPAGGTGSAGYVWTAIAQHAALNNYSNYNGSSAGCYNVRFFNYKGGSDPDYMTEYVEAGKGVFMRSKQGLNVRQFDRYFTGNSVGSGQTIFTWDENTGDARLTLDFPLSDFVNFIKTQFETDFHGNVLNLDTSQNIPAFELTMNCPVPAASVANYSYNNTPILQSGDPIDNPLFTIPFVRS